MTAFKQKLKTEFTEKSYLKRTFIYLESEEDYKIIARRWFYDEDLEFRSSGDDSGGAGGCSMVIKKVKDDAKQGIKSGGLIDRDIFLKEEKWNYWWEIDDEKLKSQQPYGENIKVLCRWELENYLLLDTDILESIKADRFDQEITRPAPIPLSSDDIELLTILTAADTICHSGGKSKVSDKMAGFQGTCQKLTESLEKEQININKLNDFNVKVKKFSENEQLNSIDYWKKQSRLLNGKAILKRLELLGKKFSDPKDRRLDLASRIAEVGKIDSEIHQYINEFKEI